MYWRRDESHLLSRIVFRNYRWFQCLESWRSRSRIDVEAFQQMFRKLYIIVLFYFALTIVLLRNRLDFVTGSSSVAYSFTLLAAPGVPVSDFGAFVLLPVCPSVCVEVSGSVVGRMKLDRRGLRSELVVAVVVEAVVQSSY